MLYPPANEHVWNWLNHSASCPSLSPQLFEKPLSVGWQFNGSDGIFSLFHTVLTDDYVCGLVFGKSIFSAPMLQELEVTSVDIQRFAICVERDEVVYYETALLPNEYLLVNIWAADFAADSDPQCNAFVVHLSDPQKVSLCVFNVIAMNCSHCGNPRPCSCPKANLNIVNYARRNRRLRASEVIETYTMMRGAQMCETGLSVLETTYIAPQISLKTLETPGVQTIPYMKNFEFLSDPLSIGKGLSPMFNLISPRRGHSLLLRDAAVEQPRVWVSGSDCSSGSGGFSLSNSPVANERYHAGESLRGGRASRSTCTVEPWEDDASGTQEENAAVQYSPERDSLGNKSKQNNRQGSTLPKARPFVCKYCGKSFGRKSHLTEHEAAVHERSLRNECNLCGVKCSTKRALARHKRRIHEEEKRFSCTVCDSSFYQKSDLKRHNELKHGKTGVVGQILRGEMKVLP